MTRFRYSSTVTREPGITNVVVNGTYLGYLGAAPICWSKVSRSKY